jgi:prolyl oligopeptidase
MSHFGTVFELTRADDGSGKPTDKIIAEASDVLAFFARFTRLDLR